MSSEDTVVVDCKVMERLRKGDHETDSKEDDGHSDDVSSSELGTKAYWDDFYKTEMENLESNITPKGWFGAKALEEYILSYMRYIVSLDLFQDIYHEPVLDIGCGNGETLLKLSKEGWKNLWGWDYSEASIELCRQWLSTQELDVKVVSQLSDSLSSGSKPHKINLQVMDVINMSPEFLAKNAGRFSIMIDKGTYDAICMNPDVAEGDRSKIRTKYWTNLYSLMGVDGTLVLVSCNWTCEELISHSLDSASGFVYSMKVNKPSSSKFTFGGKSGDTTVGVVFNKGMKFEHAKF